MIKYHLTQSLLSTWLWSYETDDGYERLIKSLNREKEPPTEAMLNGVAFENAVNAHLNGLSLENISPPASEWKQGIVRTCEYLQGAQQQVMLKRDIETGGNTFQLMGVLDFLKAGIIYDTKFSKAYHLNKYFGSPQHSMYFYLCPEAYEFQYISCDGKFVYREIYRPRTTVPIEAFILPFVKYLKEHNLWELYQQNFELENYYKTKEK